MPIEHETIQSLGPPIVENELAKRRRFLRGEPEPNPEGVQAKVLEAPQQQEEPKGVQGVQTK